MAVLLLGTLVLAGCDESSSDDDGDDSLFGAGFDDAFDQGPNDEPVEASNVELTSSPLRDPSNI